MKLKLKILKMKINHLIIKIIKIKYLIKKNNNKNKKQR